MDSTSFTKDQLLRLRTILSRGNPRLNDFFQDFDHLRHGKVSTTQFERVFGTLNIHLTPSELKYILNNYGTANKQEVYYKNFIRDLENSDPLKGYFPKNGSRLGSTSAFTEAIFNEEFNDPKTQTFRNTIGNSEQLTKTIQLLEKLKKRCRDKPIVGRLFFQDFDKQNCGLVSGTQFGRSLTTLFEALIGQFPTDAEIGYLVDRYRIKKPVFSTNSLAVTGINDVIEEKPFSELTDIDRSKIEVDYRAFVYEIGAHTAFAFTNTSDEEACGLTQKKNKELAIAEAKVRAGRDELLYVPPPINDKSTLSQTQIVRRAQESRSLTSKDKLFSYYRRYMPNIPLFLTSKDPRQTGKLLPNDFVATVVDSLGESGMSRASLLVSDIEEIAKEFYVENMMDNLIEVDYRAFINQLRLLEVTNEDEVSTASFKMDMTRKAVIQNVSETLENKEEKKVLEKFINYIRKRPIIFIDSFKAYDKVSLGIVTCQQFKQVIAQYINIAPNSWENAKRDYDRFNKDTLYVPMQKIQKEKIMKADELVFTQRDLEILASMFACDTVSARGDLVNQVPSPSTYTNSGTLINYRDFLKTISNALEADSTTIYRK